jgi:hypothetical protein
MEASVLMIPVFLILFPIVFVLFGSVNLIVTRSNGHCSKWTFVCRVILASFFGSASLSFLTFHLLQQADSDWAVSFVGFTTILWAVCWFGPELAVSDDIG